MSDTTEPGLTEAKFRYTRSFVEALRQMQCSLLVSTYQAGKLIAIGLDGDSLSFSMHQFDQVMGVAVAPRELAVGARGQIWFLGANRPLAPQLEPRGRYDSAYLTRSATVTGAIQCHELAWGEGDQLWVVNTLFSCLAHLHPDYSFVPAWRPPFVSRLAAEDRCHLNGLGMRDGRPAFVTVMAQTDEPTGWRADKNHTGCVLDVSTGEAITTGLAMPHSPRWYQGRLLVLNSGLGTLESVEPASGERTQIEALPGFTRGLACRGNLAFVGLSRIRERAIFGGVPIAARHRELKCGVGVVDLERGTTVATLEFESGVEEIFDVQVVPGTRCLALGGERPGQADAEQIWVVPQEGTTPALVARASTGQVPTTAPPPVARAATGQPRTAAPVRAGLSDDELKATIARALAMQRERRAADAVALLRLAATARPGSAELLNHLGNALQDSGDQDAALEAYRAAVAADPVYVPALQNVGYVLIARGETEEGLGHLRRAQEHRPLDMTRLIIALALPVIYADEEDLAARRAGIQREVSALVRAGVTIDTDDTLVPTNFFAAYQGENDRALSEDLARIYRPGPRPRRASARAPRTRPRIGVVSAYFRDHTIGRLNLGRIQHLSRERYEVVVLAVGGRQEDPMAAAFEAAAERHVRVPRDVAAARALICEQDLDLLLFTDVGMDALTYTLAFSRMAEIQCVTWGHPVTTGSPTIDYFLSSALLEVEAADQHYSEQLVRLPSLGTYYHRPQRSDAADVRAELGLDARSHVYACPQTLFKFHPAFDRILAGILRADPDGVLVLIEGRTQTWTRLLAERFRRTMPDVTDRIRWLRPLPREMFLRLLVTADVVLDPTGFGGGNSSYEALAMGAPTITLPGELMRSRITQALYARAGYTDLIVETPDEYVQLAVGLGTDPDRRAAVSEHMSDACEVLYENAEEIRDLERWLHTVLSA